jgi:TonB family protein
MMKLRILLPAILVAIQAGPAAWADLTVRYKVAFKSGSLMRPETAKKLEEAQKTAPTELVTRFHGDMARSEANGRVTLIDYGRQQVTVLDSKGQRFATAPFDEYRAAMRPAAKPMPAQLAAALHKFQPHAVSRDNFVLASIDGIRAEQTAVKIDYSLPAALGMGDIVAVRIETRFWRPLEEEMTRLPLLKEWAGWLARGNGLAQPASTLDNLFAAGAGEEMRGAIEALEKNADRPALKMQVAYSMPGLAALQRRQGVDPPAGTDPTGTILEIACELVDLSPALLADDLFTVPAGFRFVSMKDITSTRAVAATSTGQLPPGLKPPEVILKSEPRYTEEARQSRVEGTVVLSVIIGADGSVQDTKIVKSLSPDLDQKAIEAVSHWKFRPGEKDGKPITVGGQVQVNFRLSDKPPANAP